MLCWIHRPVPLNGVPVRNLQLRHRPTEMIITRTVVLLPLYLSVQQQPSPTATTTTVVMVLLCPFLNKICPVSGSHHLLLHKPDKVVYGGDWESFRFDDHEHEASNIPIFCTYYSMMLMYALSSSRRRSSHTLAYHNITYRRAKTKTPTKDDITPQSFHLCTLSSQQKHTHTTTQADFYHLHIIYIITIHSHRGATICP